MSTKLPLILLGVALAGCGNKRDTEGKEPPTTQPTPVAHDAAAAPADAAAAGPTVVRDAGFQTPESVLYDPDADLYLVSNINGAPAEADDNGFISKLGPDGKVVELKWIDGAKDDVKLDAPKGMALSGGQLWVSDLTRVRRFDAKTGKPLGEVAVPKAAFLNDVVADGQGGVFVTDMGVDAKFQPTGADAIYQISKDGKLTTYAKGKALGNPNGLAFVDGEPLYAVTFGTGELLAVPAKGEPTRDKLPKGQLDGVVVIAKDDLVISSWEGKTAYRGKPGAWKDLELGIESPADIGYDSKRKRLLVPEFNGNAVAFVAL